MWSQINLMILHFDGEFCINSLQWGDVFYPAGLYSTYWKLCCPRKTVTTYPWKLNLILFISFIWAERLDSRFLNKVIYVWVLMSEVCLNVLIVISNAYNATLPVKEVLALILVLDDISSSAVSSGVTVYSPWHFRTCEWWSMWHWVMGKVLSNSFFSNHQSLYTNWQVCETTFPADTIVKP